MVPVPEVDGGLGGGVADEQVPDERQAGDGYHEGHLHRPKAGEVSRGREVDSRASEEQAVRRPVEDRVEEGAEARRAMHEAGDLAVAAVEHACRRDEDGG